MYGISAIFIIDEYGIKSISCIYHENDYAH